jgi:2-phosphosulfolactate phosphatase
MQIETFFLPTLVDEPERYVCVVIDVLRATSTLTTLAVGGVAEVAVVSRIDEAFALSAEAGDDPPLICGEVGGLPPEGFDFGNSPAEFAKAPIAGRRAVLFTSNGTKALVRCAGAGATYVGSLLNRTAVLSAALERARRDNLDLALVCSGEKLGSAYCLEDAFCAGAMVAACRELAGDSIELTDAAETVLRLYRSFDCDPAAAFATAKHGKALSQMGLGDDAAFCARLDVFDVAPVVERDGNRVVVRATPTT